MPMDVVQLALMGIAIGCVYGLVALGFLMIYIAVGALNFAQGELVMIGGYFGVSAYALGIGFGPAVTISLLGAALAGAVLYRLAYYPLRRKPLVTVIVSTIAVGIVLRNLALNLWGPTPVKLPPFFGAELISIGTANLPPQLLAIVALTGALLASQYLFFTRTRLGKMMRATAQDQEAARLMGIPVNRMLLLTFMISASLAAAAGIMLAPVFFVYPDMGSSILIKGWMGIVIGGFGSIPGAIVGGIVIGLLDVFIAAFISSDFKDPLTMTGLIALLVFRPEGIFGERIAEKL